MTRLKRKMLAVSAAITLAASTTPVQAAGPLLLAYLGRHVIDAAVKLATLPLVVDQHLGWDDARYDGAPTPITYSRFARSYNPPPPYTGAGSRSYYGQRMTYSRSLNIPRTPGMVYRRR